MKTSGARVKPPLVAIVADSQDAIAGLEEYLEGAGVVATTSTSLDDSTKIPSTLRAVVLFPDGFHSGNATRWIASVRRRGPKLLIIVVTGSPQRIVGALRPELNRSIPLILQKPVFGWTILDAIRAHARSKGAHA
jgi:hypothetical protein